MKLKKDVLNVLSGEIIAVSELPVTEEIKHSDSVLHKSLIIPLGNTEPKKCKECNKKNFDWCLNCEKPICKDHAFMIMFPRTHQILNTCKDCREEIIKQSRDQGRA